LGKKSSSIAPVLSQKIIALLIHVCEMMHTAYANFVCLHGRHVICCVKNDCVYKYRLTSAFYLNFQFLLRHAFKIRSIDFGWRMKNNAISCVKPTIPLYTIQRMQKIKVRFINLKKKNKKKCSLILIILKTFIMSINFWSIHCPSSYYLRWF